MASIGNTCVSDIGVVSPSLVRHVSGEWKQGVVRLRFEAGTEPQDLLIARPEMQSLIDLLLMPQQSLILICELLQLRLHRLKLLLQCLDLLLLLRLGLLISRSGNRYRP